MLALPRCKACMVLTHYIIGAVACFTMVQNIFMWMRWFQMHKPSSCTMLPCLFMIHHHNKDYCHLMAACSMFDTAPPRDTYNICNSRLVTHAQSCACVLQSQLNTHCACKHNAKSFPGLDHGIPSALASIRVPEKGSAAVPGRVCKASLAKCNSHWHRICTCLVTGAYSKARRGSLPKNMGNPATPTGRLRM